MAAKQPTSAARATQSLALLQGQYRQRLSDCTNALLDNFVALMQLSQVTVKEDDEVEDKTVISREQFEIDVRTQNIVRASESLLAMIAELKEKLLFTDFEALSKDVTTRTEALNECRKSSEEKLRALQVDLAAHLHDLETNYFALNHNTQQSLQ